MLACSSCFDGTGGGLLVYLGTAGFMSVLPLAMVAGLVLWLRRRARAGGAGEIERDVGRAPAGRGSR